MRILVWFQLNAAVHFINGADTRTKGLDLVSNYSQDLGEYGALKWTAAFNWNQTRILNYKESTTILGTSYDLMDRQARNLITGVQPSTKLILGGDWSIDRFNLNLALTRYGSYKEVNVSADRSLDRVYAAKWITDLDLGYNLTKDLNVAIGAPVQSGHRVWRRWACSLPRGGWP